MKPPVFYIVSSIGDLPKKDSMSAAAHCCRPGCGGPMPAEAAQSHSQGHAAQELRVEFREQRTWGKLEECSWDDEMMGI